MLECAFLLAESKRAHRTAATLAYKPTAEGQLLALDRRQQQFMTKELAYTPQLVNSYSLRLSVLYFNLLEKRYSSID